MTQVDNINQEGTVTVVNQDHLLWILTAELGRFPTQFRKSH